MKHEGCYCGGRGEKKLNFWQGNLEKISCKMWAEYLLLYIKTIKSEVERVFVCLLSG